MAHVTVVGIVAHVVGAVLPFAQDDVALVYAVAAVHPSAVLVGACIIYLGVQALVGLGKIVLQLGHILLGEACHLAAQDILCLVHAHQQIVYQLLCMCGTVLLGMRVLLCTVLVGSLVCSILSHLHTLEPELGTRPHGRESLGKESLVQSVAVVLPQV